MARSEAHGARNAVAREGLSSVSAAKAASPPTNDVVASETQRLGLAWKVEDVPNSGGARIHWIGDSSPPDVLLYFHGGGFCFPAMPGHVSFLVETQRKLAAEGKPLSIAFLEYSLMHEYLFPTQHRQVVQAVNHLLQTGRQPSDIIVGGDSAGGNLALAPISAALHGHSAIPSLKLDGPLKGALLISPWVSFSQDSKSYAANVDKDIVTPGPTRELSDGFFVAGQDKNDAFAEPALGDHTWWKHAPVSSILALAGAHELFQDDILAFGKTLKEAGINAETVECPQQVHVECVLDAQSGLEHGPMSTATWEWLSKIF